MLKDGTREHIICVLVQTNKCRFEEFYITLSFANEDSCMHISKRDSLCCIRAPTAPETHMDASRNQTQVHQFSPFTTESLLEYINKVQAKAAAPTKFLQMILFGSGAKFRQKNFKSASEMVYKVIELHYYSSRPSLIAYYISLADVRTFTFVLS